MCLFQFKRKLSSKAKKGTVDYNAERMKDGVVTYRKNTSTPNSPAVDLGRMKGKVKNQRIHFIKKER